MKKNGYTSIKRFGVRYVAPALFGVSLLAGCDKYYDINKPLPVSAEMREVVRDNVQRDYSNLSNQSLQTFEEAIKDNYLSKDEQEKILESLEKVVRLDRSIRLYGNKDEISMEKADQLKNFYMLINKNLRWFDVGTPELEKSLFQDNLAVNVERSSIELPLTFFGGLIGLAGLYGLGKLIYG